MVDVPPDNVVCGGIRQGAHTGAPLHPRTHLSYAKRFPQLIPHPSSLIPFLLFLLLILAACASSAADPADTVEQYITAKVAGDRDALEGLLCSAMEADLEREAMSFNGVDATVENMSCARDGDANTVTCTGEIVAVYAGENRTFPLSTYNVVEEDGEWKWCGEAS